MHSCARRDRHPGGLVQTMSHESVTAQSDVSEAREGQKSGSIGFMMKYLIDFSCLACSILVESYSKKALPVSPPPNPLRS